MHKDDSNYYSIFVPYDKFVEYWDEDVVDYEWAGNENDEDVESYEDSGWILWYRR